MIIVEKYTLPNFNVRALIIVMILGRAHHSGIIIAFVLIFLNLEFSFLRMARFYGKYLMLLAKHFTEWQDPKLKMHRVVQTIIEAV